MTAKATQQHLSWLALWLCIVIGCTGYNVIHINTGQSFYSDIFALMPKDESNPALQKLTSEMTGQFSNRILILLTDQTEGAALAQQLEKQLLSSPDITIDNEATKQKQSLTAIMTTHSQQLLTPALKQWLEDSSPEQIAKHIAQQLTSPSPSPRPATLVEDPLNQLGSWLEQLQPKIKIQQQQGRYAINSGGKTWFIISAKINAEAFNPTTQDFVVNTVAKFQTQHSQSQILSSGLVFHAQAGAALAKQEISSVGLGSILAIIALALLVFRSSKPLLAIALVLACACTIALAISFMVFGKIHLITLVFGSTLLGVAVDYVFHFLIKAHQLGNSLAAKHKVQKALAVGALSSIGAYLIQSNAPFPGLQQMAVFSAAGLAGAWLSVYALAAYYRPSGNTKISRYSQFFNQRIAVYYQHVSSSRLRLGMISIFLAGASLLTISLNNPDDSIGNLNTSSAQLLASEKKVQQIFSTPASSRFFFVSADDEQKLLKKLAQLSYAIKQQGITNSPSLEQFVPTIASQKANAALTNNKLYGKQGALNQLCVLLTIDCNVFAAKNTYKENYLHSDELLSTVSAAIPPTMRYNSRWYSVKPLYPASEEIYQAIAAQVSGAEYIDQTKNISTLLSRYRQAVGILICITLLALTVVFSFRYQQQSFNIITPLVLSLLIATAIASTQGLTLFHLMALLLVMGIGIDTAIFYQEVGIDGDSWLAASLSSLTSLFAFGLLSLSGVPILHQFGLIVLVGIFFCWLLTPLFFYYSNNKNPQGITA